MSEPSLVRAIAPTLAALALAACADSRESGAARRPDVVLVVLDTLRADRLSCYGYERPTTPYLDELASTGVLFEDVTSQFSWTRPSMVSMFHGRYLTAYRDALEPGVATLAEVFQKAGYTTVGVVANRLVNRESDFHRGFDFFDADEAGRPEPVPEGSAAWRSFGELLDVLWPVVDERLEGGPDRAPMLVYLHAMEPHDPYEPHPELDEPLPADATAAIEPPNWPAAELAGRGPEPPDERPDWDRELRHLHTERGRYDQGVREASEMLSELLSGLRARGLFEDGVLAVVSDHGEGLWEHVTPLPDDELAELPPREFFYQRHGASQYQEVLATPFLLVGRGVPAGRRVPQPVENVDLFPTLLDLANVPTPGGLHGRSLVALMNGEQTEWRRYVYSYGVHGNSVRDTQTNLKLILPLGNALRAGRGVELYDLTRDPHERRDLSAERPEDTKRLTAVWREWLERYPTEDNLGTAARRVTSREQKRLLRSLGYTELDVGGDEE